MLRTAAVSPVRSPAKEAEDTILKDVRLLLSEKSAFALCTDRPCRILNIFRMQQFIIADGNVKWSVLDEGGALYEGRANRRVKLPNGLTMAVAAPITAHNTRQGLKVQYHFILPRHLRIHHLSYLRQNFQALSRPR